MDKKIQSFLFIFIEQQYMNILPAMAAYSFFEKKPEVNLDFCIGQHYNQLSLF